MPDLAMALRSTSSASRFWNEGFTSTGSNFCSETPGMAPPPPLAAIFSAAASICLVASGNAGEPSGVEYLMPLYSGGLCEAVKLMEPQVLSVRTAWAIAGVGAASGITMGVTPAVASTRAASATKLSPRKRESRPTSTRCGAGMVLTYSAMPPTAWRILATVNSSATIARQPEVPNLIAVLMLVSTRGQVAMTARTILLQSAPVGQAHSMYRDSLLREISGRSPALLFPAMLV